jgi:MarR-like DNA-binding transcriptional regulator SgrR of sgrS sRNA
MKRISSRWIAATSALIALASVDAARRPRYGGELRMEMRAALGTLDPSIKTADDPLAAAAKAQVVPAVFETLVRFDERGEPQPWLATSWTHDVARKRWVFAARPNVVLHNGAPWSPKGGVIEVADDVPLQKILRDLARPSSAIVVHAEDGSLLGTGPFRIAHWEAERSATLKAHDAYWAGRPFLDAIEIRMGRNLRDQELDLESGKTDAAEILVTDGRRLGQKGVAIFAMPSMETLALVFENSRVPDAMREALALSIDRGTINNVLLQKQGEASAALLPRWLSGYSFLFPAARNVARAKQLAGPSSPPLAFAYDRQDAILRPVGERIAVNASEAGITLRSATGAAGLSPDVRLVRLPITSRDSLTALEDLAGMLKPTMKPAGVSDPFQTERALLDGYHVIPLVHLPQEWAISRAVRNWPRLADVWLDSTGSKDQP